MLAEYLLDGRSINVSEIARKLGCERSTIYRGKRFKAAMGKYGRVTRQPRRGRRVAAGNVDSTEWDDFE